MLLMLRSTRVLVMAIALLLALVGSISEAQAATITVNTTLEVVANDGVCSLREAITAANTDTASGSTAGECSAGSGADTMHVPAGTYTLSFGSELVISTDLSLTGAGADSTIIQASSTPGVANNRVFNITNGNVVISSVTIRHGHTPSDRGGGIRNNGSLALVDSVITDNNAAIGGGGIFNNNPGALSLTNSVVSNNVSGAAGGGIYSLGSLELANSTVRDNQPQLDGGGIFKPVGSMTSTNSTISGNSGLAGGGIFHTLGAMTLVNTTVSANSSSNGGGIRHDGGTVSLVNSTVFGNSANIGGGLVANAPLDLVNTIVANSPIGGECSGAGIVSLGHNIASDTTCPFSATGDVEAVDPLLGPLLDNGGPTLTHAPQSGSPAIDAGDDAACPATDQRGNVRPRGEGCDIGAFELQPGAIPIPVPGISQWALIGLTAVLAALAYLTLRRRAAGASLRSDD